MVLKICASVLPYRQTTSRRLGPMPPPARPPWQPEQLNRTNSWRPSPVAVRSPAYGFAGGGPEFGGPGMGPTDVNIGGGAGVVEPPWGGVRPHAAAASAMAAVSPIA